MTDPKKLIEVIHQDVDTTDLPIKRRNRIHVNLTELEAWVDAVQPKECKYCPDSLYYEEDVWACNKCGSEHVYEGDLDKIDKCEWNYCSNCGAKIVEFVKVTEDEEAEDDRPEEADS